MKNIFKSDQKNLKNRQELDPVKEKHQYNEISAKNIYHDVRQVIKVRHFRHLRYNVVTLKKMAKYDTLGTDRLQQLQREEPVAGTISYTATQLHGYTASQLLYKNDSGDY